MGNFSKYVIPALAVLLFLTWRGVFVNMENLSSTTSWAASLPDPYEGKPFIEKVARLPVQGEAEPGAFRPVALRVVLAGNQVDTFLYSHDPNAELRVGDLEFKGSFAYWSELNGKPRALHLVNGERLRKGEHGVSDAPPPFRAQITRANLFESILTPWIASFRRIRTGRAVFSSFAGARIGQPITSWKSCRRETS